MAIYFTIELLTMVEALHSAEIIHADLKPENLLIRSIPALDLNADNVYIMFQVLL